MILWPNFAFNGEYPSFKTVRSHLRTAVQHCDKEVVQKVFDYGDQYQDKLKILCNYAIPMATMNVKHDYEVIALLIEKGVDVNVANRYGKTPLHLALERNNCNIEVIKLLLESGADVNRTNVATNSSALHFAVQNSKCEIEVLDLLLKYGAEIDAVNCVGDTPFLRALRNPNCTEDVIAWLLEHGANIEATNNFGRSALHSFVENRSCNLDVLKLLLKKGVPLNLRNSSGKSPLFRAFEICCHPPIIQALLATGAAIDHGSSTFKIAIEVCDKTRSTVSIRNLELLVRYATLRSLDYDIDRHIKTSKCFLSLLCFKNLCRRDVLKMDSREILPGVTFRDFLTGRKRLSFSSSTAEGEPCSLSHIFHFMALDQYPMYTSIIAYKLHIHDLHDNLRMYCKTETRTVWLDCYSVSHLVRYLSRNDVFNSMIAFHSSEVCDKCLD